MLQENKIFDGQYKLLKLLGRGGFSEVWLAEEEFTHLQVALKIYAPGSGMDDDGIRTIGNEFKLLFNLNHPNLLAPRGFRAFENMPYLVLPYCAKGSALNLIGRMEEKLVWQFIAQVSSGLAYLHERDIIHQDIKPDNILIDDSGTFLITDFGISTKARSTLRKSVMMGNNAGGTTAYMGPERFSREPAPVKASDIWSLGATIFELMTGKLPFGDLGGGMQKGGAEIPFIKGDYSNKLKNVVEQMLAPETWDRPLAATLAEWSADQGKVLIKQAQPKTDVLQETAGHATQLMPTIPTTEQQVKDANCNAAPPQITQNAKKNNKNNVILKMLGVLGVLGVFSLFLIYSLPWYDWRWHIYTVSIILCLILATRQSTWLWPLCALSPAIYAVGNIIILLTYTEYKADFTLYAVQHITLLIVSIYGFASWFGYKKRKGIEMPICRTTAMQWIILGLIAVILGAAQYFYKVFWNSSIEVTRLIITTSNIIATLMLTRKKIEHWLILIAVYVLTVALNFSLSDNMLIAIIYLIYTATAIVGFIQWRKKLIQKQ